MGQKAQILANLIREFSWKSSGRQCTLCIVITVHLTDHVCTDFYFKKVYGKKVKFKKYYS